MSSMLKYRAPRVRISFTIGVQTGSAGGAGVVRTIETVHQHWAACVGVPASGTDPETLQLITKGGGTVSFSQWAQDYAYNVIRLRYRQTGGSETTVGRTAYGTVEARYYEENSGTGRFVSTYQLDWVNWVQASGNNGYANQLICTFKTATGRTAKLAFQHGIDQPGQRKQLPSTDGGINDMVGYVTASSSCVRGVDGAPLVVGMSWNPGQNERLWKAEFR